MSKDAPAGTAQPGTTNPWATGGLTAPGSGVNDGTGTTMPWAGRPPTSGAAGTGQQNTIGGWGAGAGPAAGAAVVPPPLGSNATIGGWGTGGGLPPDPRYSAPQPVPAVGGMNAQRPGTVESNVGGFPTTGPRAGLPAATPGRGLPMQQPAAQPTPGRTPWTPGVRPPSTGSLPPQTFAGTDAQRIASATAGMPASRGGPGMGAPMNAQTPGLVGGAPAAPAVAPLQGGGVMAPQPFGLMQPSAAPVPAASMPSSMPPVPPGSMAPIGGGRMPTRQPSGSLPGQNVVHAPGQVGGQPRSFAHWQQPNRAFAR